MAGRDVEIVVGAKDQASRILKDVGKATNDLGKQTRNVSTVTKKATDSMGAAFTGLKASLGPLIAVVAAVKAVTAAFSFIGNAAEAFDTQEEAVRGLSKALELNGDASKQTLENHKAFASELQNVTNVGDEVTLGLMRQASMLGVSNDRLQEVTRAAIGMSEATGASLEDSLRKVNETISGNTEAFAEFIPSLRQATTDEEKLALVLSTAEKGLAQKSDKALTAAGTAERLSNTWGDFTEVIGEALSPIRMLINSGLTALIETIQTAVIPAINAMMPSGDRIAEMMNRLRDAVVRSVTFIEVVVTNLPTVWRLVADSVLLQITRIIEDAKHGFTVVIPKYVGWFADNFVNMITDAFSATITVVSNAASNIKDIIRILWDNIKSGFAGGFQAVMADIADVATRNLLEGFEAKTGELPKIMARKITESEKELQQSVSQSAASLAGEYERKIAERLGGFGTQAGKGLLDGLDLQAGKSTSGSKLAAKETAAVESRLLTRGTTENLAQQQNKLLENIDKKLSDIKKNTKPDESLSDDTFRVEVVT